jgi:hypothetical protein
MEKNRYVLHVMQGEEDSSQRWDATMPSESEVYTTLAEEARPRGIAKLNESELSPMEALYDNAVESESSVSVMPPSPSSAAASRCRSASRCSSPGHDGEPTDRRLSSAPDRGELPRPRSERRISTIHLPQPLSEQLGGARAATRATLQGRAGRRMDVRRACGERVRRAIFTAAVQRDGNKISAS